jgi:esterase/lipase superfamily enzyme
MHEEYHRWYSHHIERDLELLTFGHAGIPLIIFPTSMGRYYENKDFKLVESIAWFVDNGLIKVYCPDGFDKMSWYNKGIHPAHRVLNHMAYERMILNEVMGKAAYDTGHQRMIACGASFGGYHALNLAFRNPQRFSYVISLSGAFDIKQFVDGHYDDNVYFNNPPDFMQGLTQGWQYDAIKQMGIILGTGEEDPCKEDNFRMGGILYKNGISYWLECLPGFVHDWPWWREMLPRYLGQIVNKEM